MTEQEGFRPSGQQARTGRCALCGSRAKLTQAHVPPKAAFNRGSFAWGGTTADNRLAYGRPRLGGASRYAHCEACRASTSPWDDEYIRWAHCFAGHLLHSQWKGQRTHIAGEMTDVRPGRFIRAAIAGMTALTPKLIDSHADLVRVVREGIPAQPPEGMRFLAAIAPNRSSAHVEGSHEALVVRMSQDSDSGEGATATTPAASAVIHFAPFSLLLADRQLVDSFPHVDCTEWLQLGVDDIANVRIALPIVDLPRTPTAPVPLAMLQFMEARA